MYTYTCMYMYTYMYVHVHVHVHVCTSQCQTWYAVESAVSVPAHRSGEGGRSLGYAGSPVPGSPPHSASLECSAHQPTTGGGGGGGTRGGGKRGWGRRRRGGGGGGMRIQCTYRMCIHTCSHGSELHVYGYECTYSAHQKVSQCSVDCVETDMPQR